MDRSAANRHHEIDALRVVALMLLILYHGFVSYQPVAGTLKFISYEESLQQYWFLGEAMNIWRIPVLFVISGMAVGFILKRRTVKELVSDRLLRLVPPLVFGSFFIFPFSPALYDLYHGEKPAYAPNPGHLWFVLNLVSYSILILPLVVWAKRRPENWLIRVLRKTLPVCLLVILPLPLIVETIVSGAGADRFAFFPTRFWFCFFCYAVGFLFPCLGERFWISIRRICHITLPLALLFYLGRIELFEWNFLGSAAGTAFESSLWMLSFLGFGSLLLNRPYSVFVYLNKAVFPIYIIHMPVQQLVAFYLFRAELPAELTFLLHAGLTLGVCTLIYEFVIRRLTWLYPVMGLKLPSKPLPAGELTSRPNAWQRFGRGITLYALSPLLLLLQLGIVFTLGLSELSGRDQAHHPDPKPSSSLWFAAMNNDVEKLETFIREESPIDQRHDRFKLTPLQLAALNGSTEAAALLIESGADLDVRSEDGSTALSNAAFMGRADVVELLIEHQADLNPVNSYQSTPLDSTHAPWAITISVARMLGLTVDKKSWETGRHEVRRLLRDAGGKRQAEL